MAERPVASLVHGVLSVESAAGAGASLPPAERGDGAVEPQSDAGAHQDPLHLLHPPRSAAQRHAGHRPLPLHGAQRGARLRAVHPHRQDRNAHAEPASSQRALSRRPHVSLFLLFSLCRIPILPYSEADYSLPPSIRRPAGIPPRLLDELARCVLLCNSSSLTHSGPNASSPDELALLYGLTQLGGLLRAKDDARVDLKLPGGNGETWRIERLNAFTSERKRMSVVVRNGETGEIRLFMKVKIGPIFGM